MKNKQFEICRKLNLKKSKKHFYVLPNRYPEELLSSTNTLSSIVYFSKKETEKYKITIENGLVLDKNKNPLDTMYSDIELNDRYKTFLLVMDRNGNIYIAPKRIKEYLEKTANEIKHSSIIQGQPVAFAGEIQCDKGKIVHISDRSGHYQTPKEFTKIFMKHLQNIKANLNNCTIDITACCTRTWPMIEESKRIKDFFYQIGFNYIDRPVRSK